MARTCTHCGRPYDDAHVDGVEVLDADGLTVGDTHAVPGDRVPVNSRMVTGLAALVAVWLLASIVISLTRSATDSDAAIAVEAAATPAPTAVPTATPDLTVIEAPSSPGTQAQTAPSTEAADLAPVPSAQAHDAPAASITQDSAPAAAPTAALQSGSSMLQRQIQRRNAAVSLAYGTADGIAIVALDTLQVEAMAARLGPVDIDPGTIVLRREGSPLLVDPAGPAVTRVEIDGELIVNAETGDSALFTDGAVPAAITLAGSPQSWDPQPGERLVPIDGFGVLAIADEQDGPTRLLTSDGFEPLSEYPVLTANSAGRVEARCNSPINCDTVIVEADGTEWMVDQEFLRLGDTAHLAPDGRTLLRVTPTGYAEMFAPDKGWTTWVIGAGMVDPVWAPDSSFIAWLDMEAGPALKVMFRDTRDWIRVPLADLGAPEPLTPALIIF